MQCNAQIFSCSLISSDKCIHPCKPPPYQDIEHSIIPRNSFLLRGLFQQLQREVMRAYLIRVVALGMERKLGEAVEGESKGDWLMWEMRGESRRMLTAEPLTET